MSLMLIYCKEFCRCYVRAGRLQESTGGGIRKLLVDSLACGFWALFALTGRRTVPQILIGSHHLGGLMTCRQLFPGEILHPRQDPADSRRRPRKR